MDLKPSETTIIIMGSSARSGFNTGSFGESTRGARSAETGDVELDIKSENGGVVYTENPYSGGLRWIKYLL